MKRQYTYAENMARRERNRERQEQKKRWEENNAKKASRAPDWMQEMTIDRRGYMRSSEQKQLDMRESVKNRRLTDFGVKV